MEKPTVLIEARPFCVFDDGPFEELKKQAIEIIDLRGKGIDDPDFVTALGQANAVLCGNDLVVNDELLAANPNIRAIAKMGAGLDTVDVKAATAHDTLVFHTPGVNNQAVADHAFALILSLARKIVFCDQSLRNKQWEHTKIMGLEIWQKTLGLIGLGAIGRNVALRAKGFQMKVVAYDPYWPEEFAREQGIERMDIDQLLEVSDVVSLHTPLIPETAGLIDKKALTRMKANALLINMSRGGIINEEDLYQALKSGEIAGAGVDVFEIEPPSDSKLLELDNVVLTPHTAAFTTEAMNNMNVEIVKQLIAWFRGETPQYTVN